jgi:hypothetical protein
MGSDRTEFHRSEQRWIDNDIRVMGLSDSIARQAARPAEQQNHQQSWR